MNRRAIALGLLLAAAGWAAGQENRLLKPENFEYRATVPGPFTKAELYRVTLSPELLTRSSRQLTDIRLFDARGDEVPYAIVENRAVGSDSFCDLAITGPGEGGESSTLILEVPEYCRSLDGITVDTPARNFRKKVSLAASSTDPPGEWTPVAEDLIYDFSAQVDLRKTTIRFPATSARLLKLSIGDLAESAAAANAMELRYDGLDFRVSGTEAQPFRIDGVRAVSSAQRREEAVYDGKKIEHPKLERDKDRNTVIRLDVKLPLERVVFEIANPFFYRRVNAFSGDTADALKQDHAGGATLYALPMAGRIDRQDTLKLNPMMRRHYRFVIVNGDNPPLDIRSLTLEWIQRELYFLAVSSEAAYTLYIGSDLGYSPSYDLDRMVYRGSDFTRKSRLLTPGPVEQNPTYVPTPTLLEREKTERMILTGIIVVLLAGMGFWLFRLLRKGFGQSGGTASGDSRAEE